MGLIVKRLLELELPPGRSAFLWGPRKVGKSYWLREELAQRQELWLIDLLRTDTFAEYATRPALLRERFTGKLTVIDEVQKIPALLDEVHWLIENRGAQFVLTGSSARKLRRGHANLLGGRAWRYELGPLSFCETTGFDLTAALISGMLPPHFLSPDPTADLRAYVADYLKEEIAVEALTQNLPAFAEFLHVAAIGNAELINHASIARDVGVSAKVVRGYFQILEDTLLGFHLSPWKKSKRRRLIVTDKFYFFDVGVANYLSRRKPASGTPEFGKSFEHFMLLEIMNYRRYKNPELQVHYWRTAGGQEVDIVLNDLETAIEVKGSARVNPSELTGLRALAEDNPVKHKLVVCLETEPRRLEDGTEILPWQQFLTRLYQGEFG